MNRQANKYIGQVFTTNLKSPSILKEGFRMGKFRRITLNLDSTLTFLLIFLCEIIFSQKSIIEQKFGPMIFFVDSIDNKHFDQLILNDKIAQTFIVDKLDSLNQAQYWIRMANYDFFLNRDLYGSYFINAINLHPKLTCRIVQIAEYIKKNNNENKNSQINKFFVADFDASIKNEINERCAMYNVPKKYISFEQQLNTSKIASIIMKNDQQERIKSDIDWQLQNKLDSTNRKILDSLYSANGTLLGYSQVELDAFTFVLHHSADIDWNIKWMTIWLNEKLAHGDKLKGGMLLIPAFDRFRSDPGPDKLNRDDFIKMKIFFDAIKEKYPKEFLEKLHLYNH